MRSNLELAAIAGAFFAFVGTLQALTNQVISHTALVGYAGLAGAIALGARNGCFDAESKSLLRSKCGVLTKFGAQRRAIALSTHRRFV